VTSFFNFPLEHKFDQASPLIIVESEVKAQDNGVQYATDVKLFGRWSYEGVESKDISLMAYLNVKTIKAQVFLPFTAGRYQRRSFQKVNCPIVERLLNSLMMKGRNSGKKQLAIRIVKQAMELIHLQTGDNPLQILIDAISNGGAREDSTRIGSGGVVRRQAVDVSPLRRVNQAIYLITRGSRESSFRNIKSVSEILADEIIAASKGSGSGANSYAVRKKDEIERVAKGNR
jgi:small subunit ribosomal protein S5e